MKSSPPGRCFLASKYPIPGRQGIFLLLALVACTPTPSPAPPPPPVVDAGTEDAGPDPNQLVFDELNDAGCIEADGEADGIQAVSVLHASADQPDWLDCLFDAGTIASCGVPCGDAP